MAAADLSSKQLELLKDRNAKLSAQGAVHRQEIARLQRHVDELLEREGQWKETVLCLNRVWDELHDNIGFLKFRATGVLEGPPERDENADADLLEEPNPFLAKLLTAFLPSDRTAASAAKSLGEDLSETEAALRRRMVATLDAASRVLEMVEAQNSGSKGATGDEASPAKSGAQLAALNSLLRAENNRLRDQALQDAVKMRELETSLADREDELLVAHRKVLQLKESASGSVQAADLVGMVVASPSGVSLPGIAPSPAAAATTAGPAQDSEETERLQWRLEQRTAEVDARDAALSKAEREARELRAKLSSERSAAERARLYEREASAGLHRALDDMEARLRDTCRERDALGARLRDAQIVADRGEAAAQRLAEAGRHVRDLEGRLSAAWEGRREAEAEAQRLKARLLSAPTMDRLRETIESLEKDLAAARASVVKHRAAAQATQAARAEAAEATRRVKEAEAELAVVKQKLTATRSELAGVAAERRAWAQREEELRLFAEVAHSVIVGDNGDIAADMQHQVAVFLQSQADDVATRLATAASAAPAADHQASAFAAAGKLDALEAENARLTARVASLITEVDALRKEASTLREEGEVFEREVEGLTEAYEAAQHRNAQLAKSLAARDEDNVRLLAEAAAATRERAAAAEDRELAAAARARASEERASAERRVADLEGRIVALTSELTGVTNEARQLASRADAAARDLHAAQATINAATQDAEAARAEASKRAAELDTEAEALQRERTRAQRAEAALSSLEKRATKLRRETEAGVASDLNAEAAALRKMVNCNICSTRLKDRIITRCNHIFCSVCIDAALGARNRMCPGCGEKFGKNDVKPFFFT